MSRVVSLLSGGLIASGLSLIIFNQQPYDRQQRILALYRTTRNSLRTVKYLYSLRSDLNNLLQLPSDSEEYRLKMEEFQRASADKIEQLCEINKGVYARLGQILGEMKGVLPENYLTQFQKLQSIESDELPYEQVKTTLTESLQKPMKELFDGFQTKPFKTNLFWQSHKSILLQNYKQSVVKVMLPSTKYQSDYDLWFINKVINYVGEQIKSKGKESIQKFNEYQKVVQEAEEITKQELDLEQEMKNAEKLSELIYEPASSFYIPYYYKKYATKNTIIREYVEGTTIDNLKELKELGLSAEVAYAYIMSQLHRLMNRHGLISGRLNEGSFLIRKYIKPAKRKEVDEVSEDQSKKMASKARELIHPNYQVIFLNLYNLQSLPNKTKESIHNYWLNIKKSTKKRIIPSVDSFYKQLPDLNNLKSNSMAMFREKYYLYEPMLKIYQKYVDRKGKEEK